MTSQRLLNLFKLDAESADLDLVVDAAKEFDVSIRTVPTEVSRLIKSRVSITAEYIGNKFFRG